MHLQIYVLQCKRKHNTSICITPPGASEREKSTVGITVNDVRETVLLKTATAVISDMNLDRRQKARILFDDASQKSYMSRELCDKLKLNPIANRHVVINGACAQSTATDCEVVQIQILTLKRDSRITITCAVLENICHPLPRQPIKLATETYLYLAGIRLADFHNDVKIDILLGADYYYEFVTSIR